MEQLRAIARSPKPSSSLNRRTSLILRTDSLLAGKRSPFLGEAACHCDVQRRWPVEITPGSSRTRFRDRPETVRLHRGIGVHLHPGTLFGIILGRRSESSRNRVHVRPESPNTLCTVDLLSSNSAASFRTDQCVLP